MVHYKNLSEKSVDPDPFIQFECWYREHLSSGIAIPESVSLGTASADGKVSVRTVLLKDYGEKGFIFFTNYNSKKGDQLASNRQASLLFYWPESARQVRIEGIAEMISEESSQSYFKTRPRESQISAWASNQSSVIPGRLHLENKYDFYKNQFSGRAVDKPPSWGGFIIKPFWFEFWQERDYRLHDRITYTLGNDGWKIERLAP